MEIDDDVAKGLDLVKGREETNQRVKAALDAYTTFLKDPTETNFIHIIATCDPAAVAQIGPILAQLNDDAEKHKELIKEQLKAYVKVQKEMASQRTKIRLSDVQFK